MGELPRYDRRQPVLHNQRWAAKPATPTEPAKVPSICCSLHSPFSALRCQPELVCSTSPKDFVHGIHCLMGPLTVTQWTTDRESVADNAASAAETDRTLSVRLFVYHDDQSSPGQSKNHFLAHLQNFQDPKVVKRFLYALVSVMW